MAKRLELLFRTEAGTTATLGIDDPKEPVAAADIREAMDSILAAEVFYGPSGYYVSKIGARVVERHVETIDIGVE